MPANDGLVINWERTTWHYSNIITNEDESRLSGYDISHNSYSGCRVALCAQTFVVRTFLLFFCAVIFLAACHRKVSPRVVTTGKIVVGVAHRAGSLPLTFDSIMFTNAAGNRYSVTKLQYYLSGFRFFNHRELKYNCPQVVYIDARTDSTLSFMLTDIKGMPVGRYDSVAFYVGVAPEFNISNSLPATPANTAMGWPDIMGGGYHFLKLEGHWENSSIVSGYAIHLGTNGCLAEAGVAQEFTSDEIANVKLSLVMDVNEWFCTPHTYNFSTDGVYSMGDKRLMRILADNGADAFRCK